jgi:hypothetical protein
LHEIKRGILETQTFGEATNVEAVSGNRRR